MRTNTPDEQGWYWCEDESGDWFIPLDRLLAISRKKNERIQIGADVFITVVEIRGDKVRLGIEAPRDVSIVRSELIEETKEPEQ